MHKQLKCLSIFIVMAASTAVQAQQNQYTTIFYNQDHLVLDSTERADRKHMERYVHSKRRLKVEEKDRVFKIRFYNFSTLSVAEFENSVASQLQTLNTHFTVDSASYQSLFKGTVDIEGSYPILSFEEALLPVGIPISIWTDWQSFVNLDPQEAYIDIKVVEALADSMGSGFAQFGWVNRVATSGIVVRSSAFANQDEGYNEGKILTHLMGNYLGLYPLTGEHECGDDYVQDTPIHPVAITECIEGEVVSPCDNQPMQLHNFMSHTPDGCKDSFTIGQWKRMLWIYEYLNQD